MHDQLMTQGNSAVASLLVMKMAELQVLHFETAALALSPAELAAAGGLQQAWVIATCQRVVVATVGRQARAQLIDRLPAAARAQAFCGAEAYAFLLRFACGLESRLAGETEVFGQIKESWRAFSATPSLLSCQFNCWVQRLFKDTKEVRAGQLSGLGSTSYGSQVRRLLGDAAQGPTLLVGAGQLAQTVAPWLDAHALLLWNRTRERALDLQRLLQRRNADRVCRVVDSSEQAEHAAWSTAGNVVLCIPADAARDAGRIAAWQSLPRQGGRIVHLGLSQSTAAHWSGVPGLTDLTTLFDMLRTQSEQRSAQLARARRVCAEKAELRSLGSKAAQAHRWEDLAAFATISS
jgi:Glutamyl-tRNAGlu reductase, N-terminal domain